MVEEWRPVPGFSRYQASTLGRLRNRSTNREVRGSRHPDGYRQARLTDDAGVPRCRLRHRLVAAAFHGPPGPGAVCNHLDADRGNDRPSNLEWTTPAGNAAHAARLGRLPSRAGELNPRARLTAAAVAGLRALRRAGPVRYAELARRLGVSRSAVYRAAAGLSWKCVRDDLPSQAVARAAANGRRRAPG